MHHMKEVKAVSSIAAIMSFRLLGLFMILPIFSAAAMHIQGASATLIGVALGIYGLTQGCLQLPFGWLSDRVGRKPMITIGLCFFILGSIVCALSHSIIPLIFGRALQGAGAVGSILLALTADVTRDEHRVKAMATIGLTIGISFSIAMIVGPILYKFFGLSGIFWFSAGLGVVGLILLYTTIPTATHLQMHQQFEAEPTKLRKILHNAELLRLDFGIFALHATLTSIFLVVPIVLTHKMQLTNLQQSWIYLVTLVIAFILASPFIMFGEKKRALRKIFLSAIALLVLAQIALLLWHQILLVLVASLLVFFIAFTLLEATLPSLIAKISPLRNKGTAMGIYSTSQFLGIFIGGALGGSLFQHFGLNSVLLFSVVLTASWFVIAIKMQEPPYLSTIFIKIPQEVTHPLDLAVQMRKLQGVTEVLYHQAEKLLYLKIDRKIIDENELRKRLREGNLAK
jgi:MFS family permease